MPVVVEISAAAERARQQEDERKAHLFASLVLAWIGRAGNLKRMDLVIRGVELALIELRRMQGGPKE